MHENVLANNAQQSGGKLSSEQLSPIPAVIVCVCVCAQRGDKYWNQFFPNYITPAKVDSVPGTVWIMSSTAVSYGALNLSVCVCMCVS